jgi:histidine triad (HIT) family protein
MCIFCDILAGEAQGEIVYEDEKAAAFLDSRPLFAGHTLVVPKRHFEVLADLPEPAVGHYFGVVKSLSSAVERAMEARGTFIALNNRVSQSVPHLHTHVVPRRPKDGLRGFFWPRTRYDSSDHMARTAEAIRRAIEEKALGT